METMAPTLTVHLSTSRLPQVMTNLMTWCIQESYGFFQTCHAAYHSEVAVLDQRRQVLARLLLHVIPADDPAAELGVRVTAETLLPDTTPLLQHLRQLCTSA